MSTQRYADWKFKLEAGEPEPLDPCNPVLTPYHLIPQCPVCTANLRKDQTAPMRVRKIGGKKKLLWKSTTMVCDHCGYHEKQLSEREKQIHNGEDELV